MSTHTHECKLVDISVYSSSAAGILEPASPNPDPIFTHCVLMAGGMSFQLALAPALCLMCVLSIDAVLVARHWACLCASCCSLICRPFFDNFLVTLAPAHLMLTYFVAVTSTVHKVSSEAMWCLALQFSMVALSLQLCLLTAPCDGVHCKDVV
jgi:hypothetical protein